MESFDYSGLDTEGYTITTDTSGNIYTGSVSDSILLYLAFDQYGTMLWANMYGSQTTTPADMKFTSQESGQIYIVGDTSSSLSSFGGNDAFIHKIEITNGDTQWFKVWGDSANDFAKTVDISPDGGKIIVSGHQYSFLVGTQTINAFFLCFDNLGNLLFSQVFGNDDIFSLQSVFGIYGDQILQVFILSQGGGINKALFRGIQSYQWKESWGQLFGSSHGTILKKYANNLAITSDNSCMVFGGYHKNTDYFAISSNPYFETIIISVLTSSGAINWGSSFGVSGYNFILQDGTLSLDSSIYFAYVQYTDATHSVPALLSVKNSDGSFLSLVRFGKSTILSSSISIDSLGNVQFLATITSGTYQSGGVKNVFLMKWDAFLGDQSCSGFAFTSLIVSSVQITFSSLTSSTYSISTYLVNQSPVDQTLLISTIIADSQMTLNNLRTSQCSSNIIFPIALSSALYGNVNSALTATTFQSFCYDGASTASTYTAYQYDGSALPNWLSFNSATLTFQGTPVTSGIFYIVMEGEFENGGTNLGYATTMLQIVIQNNSPTNLYAINSFSQKAGIDFTYQFDQNSFNDPDGDTMTYQVIQQNGSPLPYWLNFTQSTRTFHGKAPSSQQLTLIVIASDPYFSTSTQTFTMTFTNNLPVIQNSIADQIAHTNQQYVYQISSKAYYDQDDDYLYLSAVLSGYSSLPNWLQFNSQSKTFTGFPSTNDAGTYSIVVTINDIHSSSITDSFQIIVNTAPTQSSLLGFIPSFVTFGQGSSTYDVSIYFQEVDASDYLSYTIMLTNGDSISNSWLTIGKTTGLINIQASTSNVGYNYVTVIATDTRYAQFKQSFCIMINDSPTINSQINTLYATQDIQFAYIIPSTAFADINQQSLIYQVYQTSYSALPSWLTFNSKSNILFGVPTVSNVGTVSLQIIATDPLGNFSTSMYVNLIVNSNNIPTIRSGQSVQNYTIKSYSNYSFQISDLLFYDIDGDSLVLNLQYSNGSDLDTNLISLNPSTRLVSGYSGINLPNISLKIIATDSKKASTSASFYLFIQPNTEPKVVNDIGIIDCYINIFCQYQFPFNIFYDVDEDNITYSLKDYDDLNKIPTQWLSFNQTNRTLSGIPPSIDPFLNNGTSFQQFLLISAFDGRNGTTNKQFVLRINKNFEVGQLIGLLILGVIPLILLAALVVNIGIVRLPSIEELKMQRIRNKTNKQIFDQLQNNNNNEGE